MRGQDCQAAGSGRDRNGWGDGPGIRKPDPSITVHGHRLAKLYSEGGSLKLPSLCFENSRELWVAASPHPPTSS